MEIFSFRSKRTIEDDHLPFLKRDVPAVDIIDLDGYQYWHTTQDTLDKVSAASLGGRGARDSGDCARIAEGRARRILRLRRSTEE